MTFLESEAGEPNEVELAGSLLDFLAPTLSFLNLVGDLARFSLDTPDVSASPPLNTGEPMNSLRSPVRACIFLTCLPIENEQIELRINLERTYLLIKVVTLSFAAAGQGDVPVAVSHRRAATAVTRRWADCDPSRITDEIITETLLKNFSNET